AAHRDPVPAHCFVEKAGIVLGMGPDQAGAQLALLQSFEGAAEKRPPGAASQKSGIDIKRIDFALKAQAAVTRLAKAAKPHRAKTRIVRNQDRPTLSADI